MGKKILSGKKVIPLIRGGLGNQLFIYAMARRLALFNNAELILDGVSGFSRDYAYRREYQLDRFNIQCRQAITAERLEPFSRLRRYVKRRLNQRLKYERRSYLIQEGVDFDKKVLGVKVVNTLFIEGYWQSEDYFKDIEFQIRNDLRIKPPLDSLNKEISAQINSKIAVAVHVRFFDAVNSGQNNLIENNASKDYYARAIDFMEKKLSNAHYYVFSDQPDVAESQICIPKSRFTLIKNNVGDEMAYADLWLMTQCKHFIIANSTFSWWGAWLGLFPDKIVIAPGFERRNGKAWWGFQGLLPKAWIKI